MAADRELPDIEVVLCVHSTWDVDVELDYLKESSLQLIPNKGIRNRRRKKRNLHIVNLEFIENLAIVDIPHGLIVPDFTGEKNGTEQDTLPIGHIQVYATTV